MTASLALERAPDYAEAIETWRVWRVVAGDRGAELGSVIKAARWPVGEPLVAGCLRSRSLAEWLWRSRRHGHLAPDPGCECGIYGAGLDRVGQYLTDALPAWPVACVIGVVSLWGTVVECERGYRASHAYPRRIYVPDDARNRLAGSPDDVAAGLERYGVPVELLGAPSGDATRVLAERLAA